MNSVPADTLPHRVTVAEHTWITMRDGIRLSARIWLPETADAVPAVLEYIPYRKRDWKRSRDNSMHSYFAGHGYAAIKVDMRGSGESEGVLQDEYLPLEQQDAEDVLAWLEAQPWCTGRVGMIGISWGGFNGLQVSARQPPQLQAVISICSTDDRYTDDVHYMGGCLLNNNVSWASTMLALNSLPPDPEVVGDRWKGMWLDRLNNSGLWVDKWMRHQHRDDYWKHGSVAEDYGSIQCPVLAVSGWADGYSNSVFRLMEHLTVPRKALIGPWGHKYPQEGTPGPAIGFLQEAVRWWDRWLKDVDNGVMDEPMVRSWMQDSFAPEPWRDHVPGRWIAEDQWPPAEAEQIRFNLGAAKLIAEQDLDGVHTHPPVRIESPLTVGLSAGKWYSTGGAPDLPGDQRPDDGGSLVFDSDELEHTLEIHGAPVVTLQVSANKRSGMIAVRLSDVAPDQSVSRVTYGLLNLCHRNGHDNPEPVVPGRVETIQVSLNGIAHSFAPGHRLRLSVSTVYWPIAWPSPESVQLTLFPDASSLALPSRRSQRADDSLVEFGPVEAVAAVRPQVLEAAEQNMRVVKDLATNTTTVTVVDNEGKLYFAETDHSLASDTKEWYSFTGNDFDSVRAEVRTIRELTREGWEIRTESCTVVTSDKGNFYVEAALEAFHDEHPVFSKTWNEVIRRDGV